MAADTSRTFYRDLPPVPAAQGMCDVALHRDVPGDWCVVIVDIVGSTDAIARGKYKEVNTVAASAITAILNVLGQGDAAYIFGGDGATLLVPAALAFDVATALYGTREMAREAFQLDMRAGIVFAGELQDRGAPVRVAKTAVAPGVHQSAMSGDGIALAEKLVKDKTAGAKYDITALFDARMLAAKPADFTGLQCRWQPLETRNGVDLSLIVLARSGDDGEKAALYRQVLDEINTICGGADGWKPVSPQQLNLAATPKGVTRETAAHTAGHGRGAYIKYMSRAVLLTLIGKICLALGIRAGDFDGASYRQTTAQNNDYIKFDNILRAVMDVTAEQQARLAGYLDGLYRAGKIFYGIHAASSALMTCLVFDYGSSHFHFVDGADGGYALAAKQMKQQMKDQQT